MLQFQLVQALTPLSIGELVEKSTKLSHEELICLCQTFMLLEHRPKGPPPYGYTFFTDVGRLILNMISSDNGFEY